MARWLYRLLAQKVGGTYAHAEAKTLYHPLREVSATVTVEDNPVVVPLHKRAHNPLLKAARLADQGTPMPWFGGKELLIRFS
jgi:hypothetical protein